MKIDLREKVRFGDRLNLKVTRFGMGTCPLGGYHGPPPTDEEADSVLTAYQKRFGALFIDTATMYGAGTSLQHLSRGVPKLPNWEEIVIQNKLLWLPRDQPRAGHEMDHFEPHTWEQLPRTLYLPGNRAEFEEAVETGMGLLGDQVNCPLVALHDPHKLQNLVETRPDIFWSPPEKDAPALIDDFMAVLKELKESGKVQGVATGQKDISLARMLYQRFDDVFTHIMLANEFSVMNHEPWRVAFLDWLQERGLGICVAAPYHSGYIFNSIDLVDSQREPTAKESAWRDKFRTACEELQLDRGAVATHFVLSHPAVHTVAAGTSKIDRIERNFPSVGGRGIEDVEITREQWQALIDRGVIESEYKYKEYLLN